MHRHLSRILLVEDNPGDAVLVREYLDDAGVLAEVTHHTRLADATSALANGLQPDVAILDLSLPDAEGLDTVRGLLTAAPTLAVVVMSGQGDEATGIAAVQAGAQDYLVKGEVDGRVLARCLRYAVERARTAAALAEQNRLLAERTSELERLNAEQEAFIFTASHDLRQPLLALQGMAGVLEETVEGDSSREVAYLTGRIRGNVTRMGALLDDLLAISRVGRLDAACQAVPLAEVAREVMSDLRVQAVACHATIEQPASWPTLYCSPTEARQVLSNLLGNALKFCAGSEHPPLVRLEWRREGRMVRLSVSDNGPGVAPPYRERVFGLFQKLDAGTPGTGVGLAIVKRIALRHGGEAWVEDSPLGGAAFHVTLPAG
ncbi:MAG TPA: ATP-binding protein [Deinococcales bacterium]|nr:ATP-binding protein [Deinococcales bacterium]